MSGWKRTSVIILLLAVVVGAGYFIYRTSGMRKAGPPQRVLNQPIDKVDSQSLQVVTKSLGEWQKLGEKDGLFKNPNTGAYSMVDPMTCAKCGQTIPVPVTAPGANRQAAMMTYKCPKCGKLAY